MAIPKRDARTGRFVKSGSKKTTTRRKSSRRKKR